MRPDVTTAAAPAAATTKDDDNNNNSNIMSKWSLPLQFDFLHDFQTFHLRASKIATTKARPAPT